MSDAYERFLSTPGRILLDTCIINILQDEGGFIWENELPDGVDAEDVDEELEALQSIFQINERASFQFAVSPLSVAEVANEQEFHRRARRVQWVLDVIDPWIIAVEDTGDRARAGGTVRHRFKLTDELQALEAALMQMPDFRRDPFDRLLMIQYKMANCDAFLTTDKDTIWKHRRELRDLDIRVMTPSEFWEMLKPWAALWR